MPVANDMRPIAKAEVHVVEYELAHGYALSYGMITKMRTVLLKLTDEDGVHGWGEANPQPPFTVESVEQVVEVLRSELVPAVFAERDPDSTRIDQILDARRDDHLMAKGAITMALLDIKGKRLGKPVAELLGTILHRSLPVLWPLSDQHVEDDIAIIDAKLAEGFASFMLKMGQLSIPYEIERVAALEKRYGDKVKFVADSNTGWTFEETKQFLEGVRGSRLIYLEQPINKYDIDGMSALAKTTPIPLSVDESLTGVAQAREIIAKRAARVFSIKSSKNGGPLRAKAITDLTQPAGIKVWMNSMLELGISQAASLQHGVTLENLLDFGHAYMSTLRVKGDPTNFASFVKEGIVHLPAAPGLGIEVDEEKVEAITVEKYTVLR